MVACNPQNPLTGRLARLPGPSKMTLTTFALALALHAPANLPQPHAPRAAPDPQTQGQCAAFGALVAVGSRAADFAVYTRQGDAIILQAAEPAAFYIDNQVQAEMAWIGERQEAGDNEAVNARALELQRACDELRGWTR
jgi:hypothetical protein